MSVSCQNIYEGDFDMEPMAEKAMTVSFGHPSVPRLTFAMGIKTITHNRAGIALRPQKIVALEMSEGDVLLSIDIDAKWARRYAERLIEYADAMERVQ